jgi:hypothetical protein
VARLEDRIQALRDAAAGRLPSATDRDIAALQGAAYSRRIDAEGGNASNAAGWEMTADDIFDQLGERDALGRQVFNPSTADRADAVAMLQEYGLEDGPKAVDALAPKVTEARLLFAQEMGRRADGNWSGRRCHWARRGDGGSAPAFHADGTIEEARTLRPSEIGANCTCWR